MRTKTNFSAKGILITLGILALCTCVGFGFAALHFDRINTILIYIVGVVLIAMFTQGRGYSMTASILSVFCFNFFFAKPYFSLVAEADYFATFAVMLLASFLVSSLTIQIKNTSEEAARNEERIRQEELRSNLLRSISHDLRTPLTGISGNAAMLLKHSDELSEETKQEIYNAINSDSKWLINLVENLLSITRINDSVNLQMQPEYIQEIVDEAIIHIDANSVKHKISRHYCEDPIFAEVDSKLITQVVINIINNAIKYTDEESEIEIHVDKVNQMARIVVADNGNGIPDSIKDKIFEQFYSEGKFNGDSRRGLGLGLYLCKIIMEVHGGTIHVEDNEPTGAKFVCMLPVVDVKSSLG